MVVVVTSPAAWHDRRDRIRTQFARNLRLMREGSAILKFALGVEGTENHTLTTAQREARIHEDILFFDCLDMDDSLNHIENWRQAFLLPLARLC